MTNKQYSQMQTSLDSLKDNLNSLDKKIDAQHLKLNGLKFDVLEQFTNHLSVHSNLDKKINKYGLILAGSILVAILFNHPEYVIQAAIFISKVF